VADTTTESHTARNCRWSEPDYGWSRRRVDHGRRRVWTCKRPPEEPRHVTDAECAECPDWELAPDRQAQRLFWND